MKSLEMIDRNGLLLICKKLKGNQVRMSIEDDFRDTKEVVNLDKEGAEYLGNWLLKASHSTTNNKNG